MSNFVPSLYISIGETSAFFTLRETYEHVAYIPSEGPMGNSIVNGVYQGRVEVSIRSFHHFNLSQDADEAFAKAKACSEQMGLKLTSTRDQLTDQMRDIKRAKAEELAERQRRADERQAQWDAERELYIKERNEKIEAGFFTFGPYAGKKFEEAPRGYLSWLMDMVNEFEAGSVIRLTAESVLRLVPHLAMPKPDKTLHVGAEKQRLAFDVIVIASRHFVREGFGYGGPEVVYVTTMMDKPTGACLVVFSTAFAPDECEEFKIKATVKSHDEYKGQAQTIVQRVTVL